MTAWEMVEYYGRLAGMSGAALTDRMHSLFDSFQMTEFKHVVGRAAPTGSACGRSRGGGSTSRKQFDNVENGDFPTNPQDFGGGVCHAEVIILTMLRATLRPPAHDTSPKKISSRSSVP
jgi:hypothetical protein